MPSSGVIFLSSFRKRSASLKIDMETHTHENIKITPAMTWNKACTDLLRSYFLPFSGSRVAKYCVTNQPNCVFLCAC